MTRKSIRVCVIFFDLVDRQQTRAFLGADLSHKNRFLSCFCSSLYTARYSTSRCSQLDLWIFHHLLLVSVLSEIEKPYFPIRSLDYARVRNLGILTRHLFVFKLDTLNDEIHCCSNEKLRCCSCCCCFSFDTSNGDNTRCCNR